MSIILWLRRLSNNFLPIIFIFEKDLLKLLIFLLKLTVEMALVSS
jgi:hypothetical protein